jgi:predicted CXXCH cytochrome family protein
MKKLDRRYLSWAIGLAACAALPLFAGFTKLSWELAEILGLAAALACIALSGCPVRPRESTPPVLLTIGRHQALGWIALGAAALHVIFSLISDHTVVQYLLVTSPLYELAGIAGFILLLALVATSLAGARRRLWRSHRNFQATHIGLGCLLIVLLSVHVITAGRYTGGYARRIAFVAVAAGGMVMLWRSGRRSGTVAREATVARRFVFGRHSTLLVSIIAVASLSLVPLIAGRAGLELREPLLGRADALPLNFDHGKHAGVNCLTCHHNYADGRGFDRCINCHRSSRADLKLGVEARFHAFCLDCHRNPSPALKGHGPVSACETCHQPGMGAADGSHPP